MTSCSRMTYGIILYNFVICMMFVELVVLALTCALIYHLFVEFPVHNLPPGPRPWPLVGNIPLMGKNLPQILSKLSDEYGNVFRLFTGHKLIVVVSGDMINEALVRNPKQFAGRPKLGSLTQMTVPDKEKRYFDPGLPMMPYGPKWKLFRKLNHSAIRVYSEGNLQEVIGKEVEELCKRISTECEKGQDIRIEFNMAVTNIIMTQISGERYEIDDPRFRKLFHINNVLTTVPFLSIPRRIFQYLTKIRSDTDVMKDKLRRERYHELEKRCQQHKAEFDGETVRDFTDALLLKKQEAEQEDSSNKEFLTDENLITGGLTGLFIAGSETTSTTLSWAVVYLLNYPDLQERLNQEIVDLIGPEEFPTLNAKKQLPVLEAFTTETLRVANLVPLAVPHMTTEDVTLKGFHIPKETTVFANTWALHHDPKVWKDPFTFNVDRHLDENGKFVPPVGGTFLPFGAGPRVCVGEVLARSELFMFLCRLLQQFKFENPNGCEPPSMEGESAVVLRPKPYLVRVVKR